MCKEKILIKLPSVEGRSRHVLSTIDFYEINQKIDIMKQYTDNIIALLCCIISIAYILSFKSY
jgi:hypothetical protein